MYASRRPSLLQQGPPPPVQRPRDAISALANEPTFSIAMPDERTLYRSWDQENRAFLEVLNPTWWRETLQTGPPPRNDVEYERNRAMERMAAILDRVAFAKGGVMSEERLLDELGELDAWVEEGQAELRASPYATREAAKFLSDFREMLRATAQLVHEKKGVGMTLTELAKELYLAGAEASKEMSTAMQERQQPSFFGRWGGRVSGRERARSASERALQVFRTLSGTAAGREIATNLAALLRVLLYQAGDYAETALRTGSAPPLMGGVGGAGAGAGGLRMGGGMAQGQGQVQQGMLQQDQGQGMRGFGTSGMGMGLGGYSATPTPTSSPALTRGSSGILLGGGSESPISAPQQPQPQPQYFSPQLQQQQPQPMGAMQPYGMGQQQGSMAGQQQPSMMMAGGASGGLSAATMGPQLQGKLGQEVQARLDKLVDLTRAILSQAAKDPQLQGALNELLSLFWEYQGQLQQGMQRAETSRAAQTHAQRAASLADRLLMELTGGTSMQRLTPQLQQFAQIVRDDPNINQFYQNLRAFINSNLQNPDAIPAEAFKQQFWNLYQQGESAFRSVQQQVQPLAQDMSRVYSDMVQNLRSDRTLMRYMESWSKMGSTFFYQSPSGTPTLNTRAVSNVAQALLPMLANTLKFMALPPLLYEDPSTKLLLDELVIFTPTLPPDTLQAHFESFFSFDFERLSYARQHGILTTYLRNIKLIAPNFRFGIRRKTGLAFVESGHADMFTAGRGVNIALSFQHRSEFPYLSEPKAKCEIDDLDVRLGSDIKHTVVGPTIVSMFKGTVKSQLESAIERALVNGANTILERINRSLGLIAPSTYGLLQPPQGREAEEYGFPARGYGYGYGYGHGEGERERERERYRRGPSRGAWWLPSGRTKDEEAAAVQEAYLSGEDAFGYAGRAEPGREREREREPGFGAKGREEYGYGPGYGKEKERERERGWGAELSRDRGWGYSGPGSSRFGPRPPSAAQRQFERDQGWEKSYGKEGSAPQSERWERGWGERQEDKQEGRRSFGYGYEPQPQQQRQRQRFGYEKAPYAQYERRVADRLAEGTGREWDHVGPVREGERYF